MIPADLLELATADGVELSVSPSGTIKATGSDAAVSRWLPLIREHKPALLSILRAAEPASDVPPPQTYTAADLAEMDALLLRLSELEGWGSGELEAKLDERRRMAPVNVLAALQALRAARDAAQAGWPEKPAERAQVVLCRLLN